MAKARYYGMATREEKQDVARRDNAARVYPNGPLTYSAVVTAILNYKKNHPNFDELSTTVAADRIATELKSTGRYGSVTAQGSRISGDGYSISLTKGKGSGGVIVASKASEQVNTDKRKKRKK